MGCQNHTPATGLHTSELAIPQDERAVVSEESLVEDFVLSNVRWWTKVCCSSVSLPQSASIDHVALLSRVSNAASRKSTHAQELREASV
mmetsp:Transcript_38728/g.88706  ORF Transcript_38728/g.88706 Transcript_38728/m.88706 type:complete len:89 (-) Transcript_38728:1510-1776(-)